MNCYEVKNIWDIFNILQQNEMGMTINENPRNFGWIIVLKKFGEEESYEFMCDYKIPHVSIVKKVIESVNNIRREKEKYGKQWVGQKYSRFRKDANYLYT